MRVLAVVWLLLLGGCTASPGVGSIHDLDCRPGRAVVAEPRSLQDEVSGIRLVGTADPAGQDCADVGHVLFTFVATNEGSQAALREHCGNPPHYFVLRDASGNPLHRDPLLPEPAVVCEGYLEIPFPAGAQYRFTVVWNGTFFEDGWRLLPASAGDYTLTGSLFVWRGDAPSALVQVSLAVPVRAEDIVIR